MQYPCWFHFGADSADFFLEATLNFFLESGDFFFFFWRQRYHVSGSVDAHNAIIFFKKNLNTYKKFIEKYFLFFILSQIIFSLNLSIQTNLKEYDFSKSKVFNLAPKLHAHADVCW